MVGGMTTPTRSEPAVLLDTIRARIADEILTAELPPAALGVLTLHPHQRRAVARIRQLLRLAGGAMLADATGLGKTFVALAVAAQVERLLIVVPAALVDAWRHSAGRAGVNAIFVSAERLSRGAVPPVADPELVIVDEAHHFRNPRTKRYASLAAICDRSRVLLLSATPLQNRREDLVAELALFLGDAAASASDEELARFVVRRRATDAGLRLPVVIGPTRVELAVQDDLLDELLALPAPILGRDEGEAAVLVTYALLRQWSSSRAALVAGLRRRLAKAVALTTSLEAGRWPSREELTAWSFGDNALQLALPELLSPLGASLSSEISLLLTAVREHADGVRRLLSRIRSTADPDQCRAATLDDICQAHPNGRVIAFSQYAETVQAIARLLMTRRAGVAELTGRGGRVAGGRISRRDVLSQFTPHSHPSLPRDCERISLLVATDVLSEGLDLQNASVIVHLDLPWNPARLEQRVGRARRLGSPHDEVHVYAISPPASSERVLRVDARLRAKFRLASTIVGLDGPSPDAAKSVAPLAPPEIASDSLAILERWRRAGAAEHASGDRPLIAGVIAPNDGLLVLVAAGEERLLLASIGSDGLSLDAALVARVLAACDGPPTVPNDDEIARAMRAAFSWTVHWMGRRQLALGSRTGTRCRARLSRRITELLAAAPRHERAALADAASRARRTLARSLGAGAERALTALAGARHFDTHSLDEIAALSEQREARSAGTGEPVTLAVIILRRSEGD
jgi:superfamily II DNA or RNA helicase